MDLRSLIPIEIRECYGSLVLLVGVQASLLGVVVIVTSCTAGCSQSINELRSVNVSSSHLLAVEIDDDDDDVKQRPACLSNLPTTYFFVGRLTTTSS
eukprot:scaffold1143_cov177-Amphora_coffeaeformis.AAC.15